MTAGNLPSLPLPSHVRGIQVAYNPYFAGRTMPSNGVQSRLSLPLPSRGGGPQAQLNLGDVGHDLLGIGLDWLRNRVLGGGGGSPVIPGGGGGGSTPLVPGPAAPGCPEGQIGVPPFCVDLVPGGGTQGGGVLVTPGEAVMGRYGAALQPSVKMKQIKRCLRGMVLGNDGLCYNRRDLNKRDRMWVPGRKPLLTGGDLNAIARASRAAGKMKTQQKRLQKLGLLPKPNRGGRGKVSPHTVVGTRALPGTSIVNVD